MSLFHRKSERIAELEANVEMHKAALAEERRKFLTMLDNYDAAISSILTELSLVKLELRTLSVTVEKKMPKARPPAKKATKPAKRPAKKR